MSEGCMALALGELKMWSGVVWNAMRPGRIFKAVSAVLYVYVSMVKWDKILILYLAG